MEEDTVDRAVADTVDKPVEHTVDVDVVVAIGVEDVVHLLRQHRTTTCLRLVIRLLHYLAEEKEHRDTPRTLSKVSTIGTIVSHVVLLSKRGIHAQHAHRIGKRLVARKGATGITYNSTLWLDILHQSRDSIRISCLGRSDR